MLKLENGLSITILLAVIVAYYLMKSEIGSLKQNFSGFEKTLESLNVETVQEEESAEQEEQ